MRRAARFLAATLVFVVSAFTGCGGKSDYEIQVVSVYCYLGAQSQAQYSGCVDHVSLADVEQYAERGSRTARRALELGDFTFCGYRRCVESPNP